MVTTTDSVGLATGLFTLLVAAINLPFGLAFGVVRGVNGAVAPGVLVTTSSLPLVAISANDVANYPEDSPAKMAEQAKTYPFPYLYDESQATAKAYQAACTPDFFLFDANRELVYRGQFDGSRPGSPIPVTGNDLRAAADAVLVGQPVLPEQRPSIGCNIKWKTGNAPAYYR